MKPESITAAKIANIETKYLHILSRIDSIAMDMSKLSSRVESLEKRILLMTSDANRSVFPDELLQRILFNQNDMLDGLNDIKKTINPLKHITIEEADSPSSNPPF